jgi:hypothetical protein
MSGKNLMQDAILPKSRHARGSTVIQQMGLDTPMGVQRLMMILLAKLDPESNGINITLEDLNRAVSITADAPLGMGKANLLVRGKDDALFLKLCDEAEWAVEKAKEENNGNPSV